jgi:G3E family GTPase
MVFKSSKAKANKSESAPSSQKEMNMAQASHLTEKNSKTIVKLCQLLEVQKKDTLTPAESAHLSRRIEKLKSRVNRRIIRLAKWVDKPEQERHGHIAYNTRASSTNIQTHSGIKLRGRPRGPNYKGFYKDKGNGVVPRSQTAPAVHNHHTYMEAFNKTQQAIFQSTAFTKSFPAAAQSVPQPVVLTNRPAITPASGGNTSHLSTLIDLQRKMAQSTSNALAVVSSNAHSFPAAATETAHASS